MIVKRKIPWIRLLFQFRGSSLEDTWPRVLVATIIAILVTVIEHYYGFQQFTLTLTPFTLIGVALGIFLGFRNNVAYDRFWEGRKLWGSLTNTSRSLARQCFSLVHDSTQKDELTQYRRIFIKRVIAYCHALRHHLRDTDPVADITAFLPSDELDSVKAATNRPVCILQHLGLDLAKARDEKWLHELNVPAMETQLVELTNILGGCDRIKNTPIPFSYTVLIHRIVASYCMFLPFGIIDTVGIMTPVVVLLISHAFFGLDAIGDEIEEPFGTQPNDLPLFAITRNIEGNLLEIIHDPNTPDQFAPTNGILQ